MLFQNQVTIIFLNGPILGLFFFIFVFSIQLTVNVQYKFMPMTGFEPQTSWIRSDCSTNWATTTAQVTIISKWYFTQPSLNQAFLLVCHTAELKTCFT